MTEDGKFFFRMQIIGATVIIAVAVTIATVRIVGKHHMAELVAGGADPIKVACMLDGGPTENANANAIICEKAAQ
jgi:hypothetical protein